MPELTVTGTDLEKIIQRLHARLVIWQKLHTRSIAAEREIGALAEKLPPLEAAREALKDYLYALKNYVDQASEAAGDTGGYDALKEKLEQGRQEEELRQRVLKDAEAGRDAKADELYMEKGSFTATVVFGADRDPKRPYEPVAEVEKAIKRRMEAFKDNQQLDKVKELENDLKRIDEQRRKLLEPFEAMVQKAKEDLDAATRRRRELEAELAKSKEPGDRENELQRLHAAAVEARGKVATDALKELGYVPAELPKGEPLSRGEKAGEILEAFRKALAAGRQFLDSTLAEEERKRYAALRRLLGDYASIGQYLEQITFQAVGLKKYGVELAAEQLKALKVPAESAIFTELRELKKKLDGSLRLWDTAGELKFTPEGISSYIEGKVWDTAWQKLVIDRFEVLKNATGLVGKYYGLGLQGADIETKIRKRDPKELADALKLLAGLGGKVPVAGETIARFMGFYADAAGASVEAILKIKAKIVNQRLEALLDAKQKPERMMFTAESVKGLLETERLKIEAEDVKTYVVQAQVRRLLHLAKAGRTTDVGQKP